MTERERMIREIVGPAADGLRITTDAEGRTVYAVPRKKPRRRQSAETGRSLMKMEEERK